MKGVRRQQGSLGWRDNLGNYSSHSQFSMN